MVEDFMRWLGEDGMSGVRASHAHQDGILRSEVRSNVPLAFASPLATHKDVYKRRDATAKQLEIARRPLDNVVSSLAVRVDHNIGHFSKRIHLRLSRVL